MPLIGHERTAERVQVRRGRTCARPSPGPEHGDGDAEAARESGCHLAGTVAVRMKHDNVVGLRQRVEDADGAFDLIAFRPHCRVAGRDHLECRFAIHVDHLLEADAAGEQIGEAGCPR